MIFFSHWLQIPNFPYFRTYSHYSPYFGKNKFSPFSSYFSKFTSCFRSVSVFSIIYVILGNRFKSSCATHLQLQAWLLIVVAASFRSAAGPNAMEILNSPTRKHLRSNPIPLRSHLQYSPAHTSESIRRQIQRWRQWSVKCIVLYLDIYIALQAVKNSGPLITWLIIMDYRTTRGRETIAVGVWWPLDRLLTSFRTGTRREKIERGVDFGVSIDFARILMHFRLL